MVWSATRIKNGKAKQNAALLGASNHDFSLDFFFLQLHLSHQKCENNIQPQQGSSVFCDATLFSEALSLRLWSVCFGVLFADCAGCLESIERRRGRSTKGKTKAQRLKDLSFRRRRLVCGRRRAAPFPDEA